MKQFILPNFGVYFCSAMGVNLFYWPTNPSSNTAGTFVFMNSVKILNVVFPPQDWIFFCHYQDEHMLEIHILASNIEVWACMQKFPQRVWRILESPDIPLPRYHPLGHRTAPPVVRWCSFHIPRLQPALRSLQVPPLGSGPATPQHPVGSGSGNEDPQSGSCYSRVTVKIKKPFVFKSRNVQTGPNI